MYLNHWGDQGWFINMPLFIVPLIGLIMVAAAWSIFWKGLALWHAAQRGEPVWFVILLFINTLGILEIVYLFGIAKLKFNDLFSNHVHAHHDHSHHEHHHN